MNENKRQQLLAILAIVSVGLLAINHLVVNPLTSSWKSRQRHIADLRNRIRDGADMVEPKRQHDLRATWAGMKTNTLPGDETKSEQLMLNAFDQFSQNSRISVNSVKPNRKQVSDDYETLECRLDGFGSINSLNRFLFEVGKSQMGLKVESLEISSRDPNGQSLAVGLLVSGLILEPPAH